MAAIQVALKLPAELFAEMNFTDLLIGGTYLLVLLSFGTPLIRRLYPAFQSSQANGNATSEREEETRSLGDWIIGIGGSLLGHVKGLVLLCVLTRVT